MTQRPPRLARALLAALLPADERHAVLRDLDDEFARYVEPANGVRAGRAWYRRQVCGSIPPALAMRGRRLLALVPSGCDVVFAVRALRRRPTLTLTAVLTLALGIGANTAIFSIVDAVVLRPLPYREPERLVRIWSANPRGIPRNSVSPADFFDFQEQARGISAFAALSAFTQGDSATLLTTEPERVLVSMASPNLFETLGVAAAEGRTFDDRDAASGTTRVAIASDGFARSRGLKPGAVVTLDDASMVVVGIMPATFAFPSPAVDLWVPLPDGLRQRSRSAHYLDVVGRLGQTATLAGGTDALRTVAARIERDNPSTNRGWGVTVAPLHDSVSGESRRPLFVLLGAVACVLLIACANVAGLLLASGQARAREFSLRAAIGASPTRLVSQQLVESLLLAAGGALAGVVLARVTLSLLQQLDGFALPRAETIALDLRVLAVTGFVAILTGVLAGAAPAIAASRTDPELALKAARAAGPVAPARRLRTALVAAQIAVTLSLSVGAGLLMRSFVRLMDVDAGFDARNVVLAQVNFAGARYEPEKWAASVGRGVETLRAIPGVLHAGAGAPLPLSGQTGLLRFGVRIEGRPAPSDGRSDRAYLRWATPGYFEAMGIPLVGGRAFADRDNTASRPVAVVDQLFVARYFPAEDPIGHRLQMSNERAPREIVGVVGAVKQTRLEDTSDPHVYVPQAQNASPIMTFVVRTASDSSGVATLVRDRLREVDPTRPVYDVRTGRDLIARSVAARRLSTTLLATFAVLSGVLTVIGMYGLMAGAVGESKKEFGVRLALGAARADVFAMVIRRALATTTVGILIGLPLTFISSGIVEGMLFEVSARDAVTIVAAIAILVSAAFAGTYIPARRAVAVNPVDSLRE